MEFSDYYKHREYCVEKLQVPTMSEIRENLGDTLAEVFFDVCPEALKPLVGLTPPLEGTGDELWSSPSDLLIGKVCLKPPLTSKHMRALTHEGILEIGMEIEKKYWNEMELEKRRALAEQEKLLQYLHEKEMRKAVQQAREEEQQLCQCVMENLKSEFEEILREELAKLEAEMIEQQNRLLEEQAAALEKEWRAKLAYAVATTVKTLTEQFLEDLRKQSETLVLRYEALIKKTQLKCKFTLESERARYKDVLKQLKHYLECKNVANMMYILCMERRKCEKERETLQTNYQKEVQELHDQVIERDVEIRKLKEEAEKREKHLQVREECVVEILRQFQKFINFALRSSPTQAEFLLSVEKMMVYELTDALAIPQAKKKKYTCISTMPPRYCSCSELSKTSTKASLTIKDHHSCYNETESSVHSLRSDDVLPTLFYNQHMYVREDFRNMISQGIELRPDSMLWNKDVENLIRILKENVEESESSTSSSLGGRVMGVQPSSEMSGKKSPERPAKGGRRLSYQTSSVHFIASKDKAQGDHVKLDKSKQTKIITVDKPSSMKKADSFKPSLGKRPSIKYSANILENINFEAIGIEERRKTLLAARNSLEIIKETLTKTGIKKYDDDDGDQVCNSCSIENEEIVEIVSEQRIPSITESMNVKAQYWDADAGTRDPLLKQKKQSFERKTSAPGTIKHKLSHDSASKNTETVVSNEPVKLPPSKDSLVYQKESVINKTMATTDSKLSLVRDSLEILQERKKSLEKVEKPKFNPKKLEASKKRNSKVSMARDSVEMLKGSMKSFDTLKESHSKQSSRLSMHTDSLELLKRGSKASPTPESHKHEKVVSKESVEIVDGIINAEIGRQLSSVIKLDDDGSKVVKMSHIEVVEITEETKQPSVCFNPEAIILEDASLLSTDSPNRVYGSLQEAQLITVEIPQKIVPPDQVKIVGDMDAKEYLERDSEFTLHRVSSMLGIFRKHPSLIKMFTSGTK